MTNTNTAKRISANSKLTVVQSTYLSAHLIQVVFKIETEQPLAFNTDWIGPHLKLLFPDRQTGEIVFPKLDENHKMVWPEGQPRPPVRTYSVRKYDAEKNQLTIIFVAHAGGIASSWAQQSKAGQQIGVLRMGAKLQFTDQYLVLVGDISALPAISNILESAPNTTQGQAFIEVTAEDDIQELTASTNIPINWIVRGKNQPSKFVEILSTLQLPEGITPLFWGGMEGDLARQVRNHLKGRFTLSRDSLQITNYWRVGLAEGEFSHKEE